MPAPRSQRRYYAVREHTHLVRNQVGRPTGEAWLAYEVLRVYQTKDGALAWLKQIWLTEHHKMLIDPDGGHRLRKGDIVKASALSLAQLTKHGKEIS